MLAPAPEAGQTRIGRGGEALPMWHLIEDFFEQSIVMKLFIAVGWLAIVIMLLSLISPLLN